MSEVYFTSDTHFYHNKEFLYTPRGCTCIEEMNELVIENWNKTIPNNSLVYHLGDVLLGDYDVNLLKRLNGQLCIVRGNHDTDRKLSDIFATRPDTIYVGTSDIIKIGKLSLFLCHYPVLTANYDEKHFNQHVINLHGHTHQRTNWLFPENPFIYHVGLDSHNCSPIHVDEIISQIRTQWEKLGRPEILP